MQFNEYSLRLYKVPSAILGALGLTQMIQIASVSKSLRYGEAWKHQLHCQGEWDEYLTEVSCMAESMRELEHGVGFMKEGPQEPDIEMYVGCEPEKDFR